MKDDWLNRIINHLIMNASFTHNPGLYHGKMGIVIFFAHYARFTRDLHYDKFAGYLLDEIFGFDMYNSKQFNTKYRANKIIIESVLQNKITDHNFTSLYLPLKRKSKKAEANYKGHT